MSAGNGKHPCGVLATGAFTFEASRGKLTARLGCSCTAISRTVYASFISATTASASIPTISGSGLSLTMTGIAMPRGVTTTRRTSGNVIREPSCQRTTCERFDAATQRDSTAFVR